jgi:hypothetical protein
MQATHPTPLILLDLITLIIFCEEQAAYYELFETIILVFFRRSTL